MTEKLNLTKNKTQRRLKSVEERTMKKRTVENINRKFITNEAHRAEESYLLSATRQPTVEAQRIMQREDSGRTIQITFKEEKLDCSAPVVGEAS